MKTVVITGSTRGIGLAMAKSFLAAGCQVTLSGRSESIGDSVKNELNAYIGKLIYISCNVQLKSDLQRLWDTSKDTWGQVDIWINNAGQNAPNNFAYETDEIYVKQVIKQIL